MKWSMPRQDRTLWTVKKMVDVRPVTFWDGGAPCCYFPGKILPQYGFVLTGGRRE
jgi:hypothetical protein